MGCINRIFQEPHCDPHLIAVMFCHRVCAPRIRDVFLLDLFKLDLVLRRYFIFFAHFFLFLWL